MKRIILNGANHHFALIIFSLFLIFLSTSQALYSQSTTRVLGFKPKNGYNIALFPKTPYGNVNTMQYFTLTSRNYIIFEGTIITENKVKYALIHIPHSKTGTYTVPIRNSGAPNVPEWIGNIDHKHYGNKFWMKLDDKANLEEYSLKTKIDFNIGLLYIPFKYRYGYSLNEQNVEGPFNLGTVIHLRYIPCRRAQDLEFIVGFFQSFSTMNMDSTNNSYFKSPENKDKTVVKGTVGGFSLGPLIGVRYKGASLALASGWDFASGSLGKTWGFQRKAWLGLTVGYTLPDFIDKSKALLKQ